MSVTGSARGASVGAAMVSTKPSRKPATDEGRFDLAMWVAVLGGESGPHTILEAPQTPGTLREPNAWRPSEALQNSVTGAPDKPRAPGQGETAGARDAGTSGGAGNVADDAVPAGSRAARGADAVVAAPAHGAASESGRAPADATVVSNAAPLSPAGAIAIVEMTATGSGPSASMPAVSKADALAAMTPASGVRGKPAEASAANPPAPAASTRPTPDAPRPAGVFVVPFADGEGGEGRVRLVVRGGSLSATILSTDRETVRRLEENMTELRKALAERGFDDAQLQTRLLRPAQTEAPATPQGQPDGRASQDSHARGGERGRDGTPHHARPADAFTLEPEVLEP